ARPGPAAGRRPFYGTNSHARTLEAGTIVGSGSVWWGLEGGRGKGGGGGQAGRGAGPGAWGGGGVGVPGRGGRPGAGPGRSGGGEDARAQARLNPYSGASWLRVGGGFAVYMGPGSPLSQVQGMGLYGPVGNDELEQMEAFYRERGSPVQLELASLADPTLLPI